METEITHDMYVLAKNIVDKYENKPMQYYLSHQLINLNKIEMRSDNKDEVKYDWNSRNPSHVQYNTKRLQIYHEALNGNRELRTNLSTNCWQELEKDGYQISIIPHGNTDDNRHIVKW